MFGIWILVRLNGQVCLAVVQGVKSAEVNVKQEQMDEAAAANPPTRLLLVVHGIGQNLSGSNIAQGEA